MQLSLIILAIGINLVIIFLLYRKMAKEIHNSKSTDTVLNEIRNDVNDIILQINQATERNISLIEDRIKKIHDLLPLADKRIAILDREAVKQKEEVPLYTNIRKKILPNVKQTRNDQKISKKEQVIELYKNGFSSGIIASKVGISIGEVELIISLSSGKEEK